MSEWLVTDENGICYTRFDGGRVERFQKGEKIRQQDIDRGCITIPALEAMEGTRVKKLSGASEDSEEPKTENKKMPEGKKKGGK